jgi:uncharacterized protein YndB with AHSA1/START domain
MEDNLTTPDTFTLKRTYPHSPQQLFAVLSDPALKSRWYNEPQGEKLFVSDFRVGGQELNRYELGPDTPFPGVIVEHDGRFEDIVQDKRIVIATSMSFAGKRVSTALIAFLVSASPDGSALELIHQAVFYEGADGPVMRRGGWEVLLGRLDAALAA